MESDLSKNNLKVDNRLMFKRGKQKQFLFDFLSTKNLSQKEAANILNINYSTFRNWVNEERTLPAYVFIKINNIGLETNKYLTNIQEIYNHNWGCILGGKNRLKNIDVNYHCKILRKIKDLKRINKRIKEKPQIKNNLVLELIKNKINLKAILTIYLLTDGSMIGKSKNYRLSFFTVDKVLKDVIHSILLKESKYLPQVYKSKNGLYLIRINDQNLAKELLKFSPTFKKIPKQKQTKIDYLRKTQPSINFLKNCTKETREWSIRFAFTTDGSISLDKNDRYTLSLSCYHPNLSKEWIDILRLHNIKSRIIKRTSSWCGVGGIRVTGKDSLIEFWKIGGFLPGVKITKKSKKYKGWEKNRLLEKVIKLKQGPVAQKLIKT